MSNRRLLATFVLLVGVGATFLAGWYVDSYQRAATDRQISLQTDNATYAVRVALDRIAIAVQAVRALYASNWVTADQFEKFAKTLTSSEAIRSLGFHRLVSRDTREAYETRFETGPASQVGIWRYNENGDPVRAPDKAIYYVVESGYLLSGKEPTYGLDVTSLPDRAESIAKARESGALIATKALEFLDTRSPGVLLYVPIRDRSGVEIGVASGSITLEDLANIARLASGVSDLDIVLEDSAAGGGLAAPESVEADTGTEPAALDRRSFEFGNRKWSVVVTPSLESGFAGWTMLLVVGAGLAATAAILAYLSSLAKTAEINEARTNLAGMLDGLGPFAWLLEPDGAIVSANRSAQAALSGIDAGVGKPFWELPFVGISAAQADRIRQAVAAAGRRENVRFDLDMDREGERQVLDLWIRPLESMQGEVKSLVASAVDVTDRYESEETQRLLMRELDHRMKNTLQVIQAIIRRTARSHATVDKFEQSLIGRVNTMSRAHELLAQERWVGADIGTIVNQESNNFDIADAIHASGPPVRLNPKAALSFALAIHELVTNASKYGALSVPTGRVQVGWSIERVENEPRFVLRWAETGGPPVKPPREQGFGSMLIERSIAYELDGNANVEYRHEGLVCTISAPLRAIRPFVPDLHLESAR